MIRKHVILREVGEKLVPQYAVSIVCDRCPAIIAFRTVSPEALDELANSTQLCPACEAAVVRRVPT